MNGMSATTVFAILFVGFALCQEQKAVKAPGPCDGDLNATQTVVTLRENVTLSRGCGLFGEEVLVEEGVSLFIRITNTAEGDSDASDFEEDLMAVIPPSKACLGSSTFRLAGSGVACLPWGCFSNGRRRHLMQPVLSLESDKKVKAGISRKVDGKEAQKAALTACNGACCSTLIVNEEDAQAALTSPDEEGVETAKETTVTASEKVRTACDSEPFISCCKGTGGTRLEDGATCFCNGGSARSLGRCAAIKKVLNNGTVLFEDIKSKIACSCN